jgi:acyl dehydratase
MTRSAPPHPRGGLYYEDFATAEALAKRPSKSRPDARLVELRRRAFKQDGTLVAECRRTAFMVRRPAPTTTAA